MRKRLAALAAAGALVLGGVLVTAPAASAKTGTVTVKVGSATCKYTASETASAGAKAVNNSCSLVGAQTQYISAAGNREWTTRYYAAGKVTVAAPSGTDYYSGASAGSIKIGNTENFVWQSI